eukprot:Em0022g878a
MFTKYSLSCPLVTYCRGVMVYAQDLLVQCFWQYRDHYGVRFCPVTPSHIEVEAELLPAAATLELLVVLMSGTLEKFDRGVLMPKLDLQAAFHMVPIWPSEWELLGMRWRDQYYVDTCLPHTLLHYLDNFLLLGPPGLPTCQDFMSTMLRVCQELGMLVTMEKSEGLATSLTFLGIMLDSNLQQLRLPQAKLQDITSLTKSWVVPAGFLSLHCLIHLSTAVRRLHHRIYLDADAKADVEWCIDHQHHSPTDRRALEDHLQFYLTKAVAPSTSSTYKAGIQRLLPLTNAILEQMLGLLNSDPCETHDALTLGFFGFLRVSEFTTKSRGTFDHRIHPTRQDITWSKDGHIFFISSKTNQAGRGVTIPEELYISVQSLPCRPTSTIAKDPNRWLCFTLTLDDLCHLEHCGPFCEICYTD